MKTELPFVSRDALHRMNGSGEISLDVVWDPSNIPISRKERWVVLEIGGEKYEARLANVGPVIPDGEDNSTMDVTFDCVRRKLTA